MLLPATTEAKVAGSAAAAVAVLLLSTKSAQLL